MTRRAFLRKCLGVAATMLLPVDKVLNLLPQDTRTEFEKAVDSLHITTIQWETMGGMQLNFKVMVILPLTYRPRMMLSSSPVSQ